MYDKKLIKIDEIIKHADKNTYFRNVDLFIEKAKDIAIIQENQHVRDNLFTCFCESTLQWYTFEILSKAKQLIRYKKENDHWASQLLRRFRKSTNVLINTILKKRYTMKNTKRYRESREYVAKLYELSNSQSLIR